MLTCPSPNINIIWNIIVHSCIFNINNKYIYNIRQKTEIRNDALATNWNKIIKIEIEIN